MTSIRENPRWANRFFPVVFVGFILVPILAPLLCSGTDGLVGTADDVACTTAAGVVCPNGGVECLVLPGPDGVLGTADDQIQSLANFTRSISINQVLLPDGTVNQNLMAISIAVSYQKTGWPAHTYTTNGLISAYH